MADRTYSLEEIQDRFAIEDLYDRQLAAAEAHDWDRYDTTFTPDAMVDLTDFDQPVRAYPEYRAWLVAAAPSMLRAQRICGGLRLELAGDQATTRVPYTCHIQVAGPDGPLWIHNGNFYNDDLVRTPDGWRVARRREGSEWMDAPAGRPVIDAADQPDWSTTVTDSRQAIEHLIFRYARAVDQADWDTLGSLFEHAAVSANTSDDTAQGGAATAALWSGVNKVHADGTLRTRHLVTNLDLDIDEPGNRATVDSYFMVFQQTERLPLQPIAGGRYRDTFVRVDGTWRFESKYIWVDQVGDTSDHLVVDLGPGSVKFSDFGA